MNKTFHPGIQFNAHAIKWRERERGYWGKSGCGLPTGGSLRHFRSPPGSKNAKENLTSTCNAAVRLQSLTKTNFSSTARFLRKLYSFGPYFVSQKLIPPWAFPLNLADWARRMTTIVAGTVQITSILVVPEGDLHTKTLFKHSGMRSNTLLQGSLQVQLLVPGNVHAWRKLWFCTFSTGDRTVQQHQAGRVRVCWYNEHDDTMRRFLVLTNLIISTFHCFSSRLASSSWISINVVTNNNTNRSQI